MDISPILCPSPTRSSTGMSDESDQMFVLTTEDVANLTIPLQGIRFFKQACNTGKEKKMEDKTKDKGDKIKAKTNRCCTYAVISALEEGLKVSVDDSKCIQAVAMFGCDIFNEYKVKGGDVTFQIDLNMLLMFLECYHLPSRYRKNDVAHVQMTYKGYGHPLKIMMEMDGIFSKINLNTVEGVCDTLDFASHMSENPCVKIQFRSRSFGKCFTSIDRTSEFVTFIVSPKNRYLQLQMSGNYGKSRFDIPFASNMIDSADVTEEEISFSYRYMHLKPCFQTLKTATEGITLLIVESGLLLMQFKINTPCNREAVVEYYCVSSFLDED